MTAETPGREPEDRDPAELDAPGATFDPNVTGGRAGGTIAGAGEPGVDPEASGGTPDPEGQRRTDMTDMGVPGATGGGPRKLVSSEEAEDRLAETLEAQPVNRAEVTDPGIGEAGSAGHDDRRG
jgi:hypothetical protein